MANQVSERVVCGVLFEYRRATNPAKSCNGICPCPDHQRDGTGLPVYVRDIPDVEQDSAS